METVSNISTRKELYCHFSILSVDYTIGFKYKWRLYSGNTGVYNHNSHKREVQSTFLASVQLPYLFLLVAFGHPALLPSARRSASTILGAGFENG